MKKIFILFSMVFLINCASSYAGVATSNIPVLNKKYKVVSVIDKRETWKTFDIGIIAIPLEEHPIQKMVNDALQENDADALINIKYWHDRRVYGPISYHRFNLNAEAIKFEPEEETKNANPKKTR